MKWLAGVAEWLAAEGVGTYSLEAYAPDAVWPMFFNYMPSEPHEALVLASTPGSTTQSGEDYDEPNLQMRARSPHELRGGEILQEAYDTLNACGRITLPNGVEIQDAIGVQSGPNWIGRDERERHAWAVNLTVSVKNTNRKG